MLRKRYLLLLCVIFAGGCFIFATNSVLEIGSFSIVPIPPRHRHKITKGKGRATINTEGCTIPFLDPMDVTIKRFVEYPDVPQCPNATLALLARNKTTIWVKTDKYIFDHYNITDEDVLSCWYRSFYRSDSVDDINSYNIDDRATYRDEWTAFNDTVEIKHEFVRVNCSVDTRPIYEQFYLSAPMKTINTHGGAPEIVNRTGYNILIMGLDTISRLNLLRTMPKTANYLKKKGAIEMLGYNKVGLNTYPNLVPMLMGLKETELKKICYPHRKATFDHCPFVWEWFRQAGYYTVFAEDAPNYATFDYLKAGFGITPTDYYIRTFFYEAEEQVGTGSNLCMNEIYFYKVILDYMEDIIWRLKSKRMFGLFWETALSHDSLNYPMIMDDDYLKTLEKLEASGYFEETILFFVSDHGSRWGPMRSTKQGRLEESLPFVYFLAPPSFKAKYKKAYNNLKLNSERLTTPYDVHETLTDLIDLNNINDNSIAERSAQSYALKRGISLFLNIPGNRTCGTAGIDDQWCTCRKELPLAEDHPKVIEAAETLVKMINFRLVDYPQCAVLNLSTVTDAMEIQVGEPEEDEDTWTEYMVVVQTAPSDAVFEGVLRQSSKDQSWHLQDAPSRLNKYADQSRCVDDYKLKNYCYCI